jgi:hypothetical protein
MRWLWGKSVFFLRCIEVLKWSRRSPVGGSKAIEIGKKPSFRMSKFDRHAPNFTIPPREIGIKPVWVVL